MNTRTTFLSFIVLITMLLAYREPPKKRYFHVGWVGPDGNGTTIEETSGGFLNKKNLLKKIKRDADSAGLEDTEMIEIMGIYEFKSQSDVNDFYR